MTDKVLPEQLPRRGPHPLKRAFVPGHLMKGFLWFLLFGGLGAGFGAYGVILAGQLQDTAHIWTQGKQAYAMGYRGKVRTTNFVLKSYDLRVYYRTQNGTRHKTRVEFFRFFTGPGKGDSYIVRYLPKSPDKAVLSWAYEARYHGWAFCLLMLGMAALFLWGVWAFCFNYVREALRVRRLARTGTMLAAHVDEVLQGTNAQTGQAEYVYRFSFDRGKRIEGEHKVTQASEHPYLLNEGEELVLVASASGDEYWVLRHDGHPFML